MTHTARVFFSDYGTFGWGVSSPDLPSLTGGAAKRQEISDEELFSLAVASGLSPNGSVDIYAQMVFEVDGLVFIVRTREDYAMEARTEHLLQVCAHITKDPALREYAPASTIGDVIFVAALPSDSIATVIAAMEDGEPTTVAIGRTDTLEYLTFVRQAYGSGFLQSKGLTPASTIGELFAMYDDAGDDLSEVSPTRELVVV